MTRTAKPMRRLADFCPGAKRAMRIFVYYHQPTYLTLCERQKIGMMQRPLVEKHKLAGLHLQINAAARVNFLSWRKASDEDFV